MQCECGHYLASNKVRQVSCPECGRTHLVGGDEPGRRGQKTSARLAENRRRFISTMRVCRSNDCGHFGNRGNGTGCLLLPKPCRFDSHLLNGGGCLTDPPLFEPGFLRKGAHFNVATLAETHPTDHDVDIVTTHFNPAGFTRLRNTYRRWIPTLKNVADRVTCYELVFDDSEPEIEGSVVVRRPAAQAVMFQKEALLNLAIANSQAEYVAWIDHDIVMMNPEWIDQAVEKLQAGAVAVQCFNRVLFLDAENKVVKDDSEDGPSKSPGGAWIAKRSFVESLGGLYPLGIVGGNDQVFYSAVTGEKAGFLERYSPQQADLARAYIDQAASVRGDRTFDWIEGDAVHLYHGDRAHRQYMTRGEILRRHEFDSDCDVRFDAGGIMEWASDKPALHRDVMRYFQMRREDG